MPIIAKVNTPTKLYLYYPYGALNSPKVSVYDSVGKLRGVRNLVPTSTVSDLYTTSSTADSDPTITLPDIGDYELRYSHEVGGASTRISTDVLTVGVNPTPDIDLNSLGDPTFYLEDNKLGNTTSKVLLRVLNDSGSLVDIGEDARAVYTGQSAVDTIAVNDGDALTLKLSGLTSTITDIDLSPAGQTTTVVTTATPHLLPNGATVAISGSDSTPAINGSFVVSDVTTNTFKITASSAVTAAGDAGTADAAPAKTATFVAKQASTTAASAGSHDAGDANTTATIVVDGKPEQTINLSGVNGLANYIAAINAQVRGVSCFETTGKITLESDTFGTNSSITLSSLGSNFAAKTGLAAGTFTNTATQNVADADKVTFAEIKTIIEDAVTQTVAGDLLKVTQTTDNKIVLTSQLGELGSESKIEMTSASTGLAQSLGFTTLGTGASAAVGRLATETLAEYSATDSAYSASITAPTLEGTYFLLWYDDGSLVSGFGDTNGIQPKLALSQATGGLTAVTLNLGYRATPTAAISAHTNTKILMTRKSTELPVAEAITDSKGKVVFDLAPGEYLTTFSKDGIVFNTNNLLLTVGTESVNVYSLAVDFLKPTYIVDPVLPVNTCELYATLNQIDGTPLRDTEVLVNQKGEAIQSSGVGTFGKPKVFKSDKNGLVKFDLVRGTKVEVTIMSASLTRVFTVPSEALTISTSTTADASVITTTTPHGLSTGDKVTITGHSVTTLNTTFTVTVTGDTTFTIPHKPATGGTGGTALPISVNFLSLMSDSPDAFDIIKLDVPSAPRRSL